MRWRPGRLGRALLLLGFAAVGVSVTAAAFEYSLRRSDPFRRLPFDSYYFATNAIYYPDVTPPPRGWYTWGHRVHNNSLGFREREFAMPKPPGMA